MDICAKMIYCCESQKNTIVLIIFYYKKMKLIQIYLLIMIDIFINIAINGQVQTYKNLLAIPEFARWVQNENHKKIIVQNYVVKLFISGFDIYVIKCSNKKYLLHRYEGPAIVSNKHEEWYQFGLLHRNENDGPAMTRENIFDKLNIISFIKNMYYPTNIHFTATKVWCTKGLINRSNGPAVISTNYESWYKNGILHRIEGPAICVYNPCVCKNNTFGTNCKYIEEYWYRNGKLQRFKVPTINNSNELFCTCIKLIKCTYYEKFMDDSLCLTSCYKINHENQPENEENSKYIWNTSITPNSRHLWTTTIKVNNNEYILNANYDDNGFICFTNSYDNTINYSGFMYFNKHGADKIADQIIEYIMLC